MERKRVGIFLIVLSVALSAYNLRVTGAVIGSVSSPWLSVISSLLFIVGAFMVVFDTRLKSGLEGAVTTEKAWLPHVVSRKFNAIAPKKQKVLVLDGSLFVRSHGADKTYVNAFLDSLSEDYGSVILTPQVEQEMTARNSPSAIREAGKAIADHWLVTQVGPEIKPYMKMAKTYLEESMKNQVSNVIIPALKESRDLTYEERKQYPEAGKYLERIDEQLLEKGLAPTTKNVLKVVEKNFKVSEGDMSVVAAALYELRRPDVEVVMGGNDSDFKFALQYIQGEKGAFHVPKGSERLHYQTPFVHHGRHKN